MCAENFVHFGIGSFPSKQEFSVVKITSELPLVSVCDWRYGVLILEFLCT